MAELIGVVSGVIGIVSPAISQIEQLVDRCQNFKKAPEEFRDLKKDCEAVSDLLEKLEKTVQDNTVVDPEDMQRFKDDGESVKENFESAKDKCEAIEKYFPIPESDSSGCRGCLEHLKRACLRFLFAKLIARECEEIAKTVKDANTDGTALHRFLHITIQMKRVENEVKEVGANVEQVGANVEQIVASVGTVDKKARTIEKEVKQVGATVEHVEATMMNVDKKVDTFIQTSKDSTTDEFKPVPYVPDLSREILLDFSTCDTEGIPITMEGKLKRALLSIDSSHSEFSRVAVAVGAGGMGGVGKTNALLGLGWNPEVCEHFKNGGVYFLSFGKDANMGVVIEQLALAVEMSGGAQRAGHIRRSKTLRGAISIVVRWFGERETLFLCDDIWETVESSVGYFRELKQLLTSRGRIRMVLSTRDQHIASAAGIPIEFGPRDAEGSLSRAILFQYAEVCEEDLTGNFDECQNAIGKILRTCGGIPLTLAVAGCAVRSTARHCGKSNGGLRTAIVIYAEKLERSRREMMTKGMDGYPNFCETVRTSLDIVNSWGRSTGIKGKHGKALECSDLFPRMSVFPKQNRVPQNAMNRLWDDVEEEDVDRIIDKLVDLNLLSKREDRKSGVSVRLHDLVLEYCVIEASSDRRKYQCDFLSKYLTSVRYTKGESTTVRESAIDELWNATESRAWWSLSSDGYFPENVCWHLWQGGCVGELVALLCDVRWTVFRMKCGGIVGWQSDWESLAVAVSDAKKESELEDEWDMIENGMKLLRAAADDAWGYLQGNERELGMQLHSRLFDVDERVWPVRRYLRSVRAHCEKPWLLPLSRYWSLPGTTGSVELLVGVEAESIAMSDDGDVVAVAVNEEVLLMDVELRTILWRQVHGEEVKCVCISGNGSVVVSGSSDGTLRRWDGRTGSAMGEPLLGHEEEVNVVAMCKNGTMIVSGSSDGTLRRWDRRTGSSMGEPLFEHEAPVSCVAMSADGTMIVSGSWNRTLRRWDGRTGAAMGEPLCGHEDFVSCVAISKDGSMIVSGSFDETVRRWDGRTGSAMGEPLREHEDAVKCVAMSADGTMIVSGSFDGTVRRWDGRTGSAMDELVPGHDYEVNCVAMRADGTMIVSGSSDGKLRRWDGRTGSAMDEPLRGRDGWVSCFAMSEDGTMIVSGSSDGRLCRWDGRTGRARGEPVLGHEAPVGFVATSKDGTMIVSASYESVQLWEARTGAAVGLRVMYTGVTNVEIEEEFVFGLDSDGKVIRWRMDKARGLIDTKELEGYTGWSTGMARSGGSGPSLPWKVYESSHQLIWDGPTGVHVLATLPSAVDEICLKRVSFRARGIGIHDSESSYTVGAVVAVLIDGMVCIFHLVTE